MSELNRPMTAKELMDQLSNDPEYVRRRAEKDQRHRKRTQRLDAIEQPILERLERAGFPADSILPDLVRKYAPLPKAIVEILLESFVACENDLIRESLVRALAATRVPFDGSILAKCFDESYDEGLRFSIFNTITCAPVHSIDYWLVELLKNDYWRDKYKALSSQSRNSFQSNQSGRFHVGMQDEKAPINVPPGLKEASMNFDGEKVVPFLKQIGPILTSFGPREIAEVERVVNELDIDTEQVLHFEIFQGTQRCPLYIRVFKDDVDTVDLYFFAPPQLADQIDSLMVRFSNTA